MKKEKNVVDKFLDYYGKRNESFYSRDYVKPSKVKSIIGFIFSTLIFILLLTMFSLSGMYLFVLIIDVLFMVYYGLNLFTTKGFALPKTTKVILDDRSPVPPVEEQEINEDEEDSQ